MNPKPNVTPADVEACIASEHYFTAAEGAASQYLLSRHGLSDDPGVAPSEFSFDSLSLLTFCVLVTRNGHKVTGEAHCQNPAKFDAAIGRTEARKDAINKLWPMVVYAARERELDSKKLVRVPTVHVWSGVKDLAGRLASQPDGYGVKLVGDIDGSIVDITIPSEYNDVDRAARFRSIKDPEAATDTQDAS